MKETAKDKSEKKAAGRKEAKTKDKEDEEDEDEDEEQDEDDDDEEDSINKEARSLFVLSAFQHAIFFYISAFLLIFIALFELISLCRLPWGTEACCEVAFQYLLVLGKQSFLYVIQTCLTKYPLK